MPSQRHVLSQDKNSAVYSLAMNTGLTPYVSSGLINEPAILGCAGRRLNGQSAHDALEPGERTRRRTSGKRVLMFGRLLELALYRAEVLRSCGFEVHTPRTKSEAVSIIRRGDFDIAVLTYTLSSDTVEELATLVREYCPGCPLIAISDTGQFDRRINPDATVIADRGPAELIAALRRVSKTN